MTKHTRIVEIQFPPIVGYKSANHAIAAAKHVSEAYLLQAGFDDCIETVVQNIQYDDRSHLCFLSNNQKMLISADMSVNQISISLSKNHQATHLVSQPDLIILQADKTSWTWDPEMIAKSIEGKKIVRAFYSVQNFYLYFDDKTMINYTCFILRTSCLPFLYWNYSE